MAFAGIDTADYPGDATIKWLVDTKNKTNLSWISFYLAPAPRHVDTSWMGKLDFLRNTAKLGVAPIYVGHQGPTDQGAAAGTTDGHDAVNLADQAGFTKGGPIANVIYLDIEQGGLLSTDAVDYYVAWTTAVTSAGYVPGVYCSHYQTLDQMLNAASAVPWIFHVIQTSGTVALPFGSLAPPAMDPRAAAMQYVQNCYVAITSKDPEDSKRVISTRIKRVDGSDLLVDVSVSTVADPSLAPS